MLPSGCVVFGEIDEVAFGKPAAQAVAEQARPYSGHTHGTIRMAIA